MDKGEPQLQKQKSDEILLADLRLKLKRALIYSGTKWKSIVIIAILGALIGFGYAVFKKPTFVAVSTFVLEDSKSGAGALGQYAGLASLAGINLGGGGGGIFEGDNILELYKSRIMIEKALLTVCDFKGKKQLLIERYIDSYNLRNKWSDNDSLSQITFNGNPDNFSRLQDSIITDLGEKFNKGILNVSKPDKKLNIIYVSVASKDELFSKLFTEKLVQNVNDFYIQTKTKKSWQNVNILQHQADSVKAILNASINGVASAIDEAPNANPQMTTLRVSSQKKQVDVQANSAIYTEIVKNLELAKISFRQEKPLIQIIDKPILPLANDRVTKTKGILIGAILGLLFAALMPFIKNLVAQ